MTTSKSRVGQCRMTDNGIAFCIAEGDGYVMARQKSRLPFCMELTLWDECFTYEASEPQKLIIHESPKVEPLGNLLKNNPYP